MSGKGRSHVQFHSKCSKLVLSLSDTMAYYNSTVISTAVDFTNT